MIYTSFVEGLSLAMYLEKETSIQTSLQSLKIETHSNLIEG